MLPDLTLHLFTVRTYIVVSYRVNCLKCFMLGSWKNRFGIRRPRSPMVFTPQFKEAIGVATEDWTQFIAHYTSAYNVLRHNARLLSSMLQILVSVDTRYDLHCFHEALELELSDEDAAQRCESVLAECLKSLTTRMGNFIHILAH